MAGMLIVPGMAVMSTCVGVGDMLAVSVMVVLMMIVIVHDKSQ